MSVPKAGGPVDVIATDPSELRAMAADASGVYWTSMSSGAVMRFVE